jgi:hypothetical protein
MQGLSKTFIEAVGSRFITLPGEKLVFAQRKHWYSFVMPVLAIFLATIVFVSGLIFLSTLFTLYFTLLASLSLFIIVVATAFIGKAIVDWYFNFYVVTTKKIIEVSYKPLSSRSVSEVLLDQVKCTEIDTRIDGIMHELLDIGDVIITFDRPTRIEEFVLSDIGDPKTIEAKLENVLYPVTEEETGKSPHLFNKSKDEPIRWRYLEEVKTAGAN